MRIILKDEYDEFERAVSGDKITALRVNTIKMKSQPEEAPDEGSGSENLSKYIPADISKDTIPWERNGYIYTGGTPGKHPYHEAGVYYIQEPSAMAPVSFLDPKPDEKILDLCASPGGKSTQIASKMNGEGILVSNEIDRKRAQILSLNIERMGIRNALVTNMSPEKLSETFEGYFDKILVDAPCSGEGMVRKNEEAANQWSLGNVRLCAERQKRILDYAVKMLAPGGTLVYSTCTFAPEEDEESALYLLRKDEMIPVEVTPYKGMTRADFSYIDRLIKDEDDGAISSIYCGDENLTRNVSERERSDIAGCGLRLFPHHVSGEGHFLAVFKKKGDIELNRGLYAVNGKCRPADENDLKPFIEFTEKTLKDIHVVTGAKETLSVSGKELKKQKKNIKKNQKREFVIEGGIKGTPFMFGQHLYLAPEGMPGIAGLTVLRPGLHLGTVKKDRFEPSHALALTLCKRDVLHCYDVESDSDEAMQFIGGMSLRTPLSENGWYLITVDGFSLGWAKCSGGTLKNHYPKGLRIYT